MTFKYKPGIFIKCSNDISKIIKKILLSIIFLYVWVVLFYPINNLMTYITNTFFICSFNILISFLYYKFTKNSKRLLFIIGNTYSLINGLLLSMLIPSNIPLFLSLTIMFVVSLVILLFNKFLNIKLNYIIMVLLCLFIYSYIYNNDINYLLILKNNTWLFLILTVVIISAFLTINDCIKWRITIIYFIVLIGCVVLDVIITKNNNLNSYLNIVISLFNLICAIFVINDFKSTSVIIFNQYVYAFAIAIAMYLSIKYNNYCIVFITIIFLNVFISIVDNLYINLKNKN